MTVVAYSPIAKGAVGKNAVLVRIGKAHGKTAAQVSLRFLLQQDFVVIPRTSKVERLSENFAIFDFELSPQEMQRDPKARPAYRQRVDVMIAEPSREAALVLFSGGQDSTVCLAWALQRFARVETIGFDYGQRHAVELAVRPRLRQKLAALRADWASRLGDDHVLKLDALGAISDTALTRDTTIEIAASGLPTTFVPGRNLAF